MSEKLKEALSAVIDGEADEFELRRVLDELPKDPALRASWERYHLIGAALRGERSVNRLVMRERIWAELAGEAPAEVAPVEADEVEAPAPRRSAYARWTPLAVAAAVALAVVLGFGNLTGTDVPEPSVAASGEVTQQQRDIELAVLNSEVSSLDEERTEAYKVYHAQTRGMNQPGIGFAKMVTYQRD